jgi:hypothetical protein
MQINPLSFDYFDPIVSPRYDGEFATEIGKVGPKLIVIDTHATFWNKWKFGKNFGEKSFFQIKSKYQLVRKFGTYDVFEKSR